MDTVYTLLKAAVPGAAVILLVLYITSPKAKKQERRSEPFLMSYIDFCVCVLAVGVVAAVAVCACRWAGPAEDIPQTAVQEIASEDEGFAASDVIYTVSEPETEGIQGEKETDAYDGTALLSNLER